jgi:hypothetical protein
MPRWRPVWRRPREAEVGDDFVLVVWDSCRFDAVEAARTPVLDRHGPVRRAYTHGTYTVPAHVAMFQGFLPHAFVDEPFYNRHVRQLWRIDARGLRTPPLVALPAGATNVMAGLRRRRYATLGVAAMPFFRDVPALRAGFDRLEVTATAAREQNRRMAGMLARHGRGRPVFCFVNYGETHSPFRHADMPPERDAVDHRYATRAIWAQRGTRRVDGRLDERAFARQVACAEFLDARTGELLELFRARGRPTTVVICADHGGALGEDGLFGHAMYHPAVMEVPLLIFRLNAPPHPAPAEVGGPPG